MRKLSQITTPILPFPSASRSFGRRPVSSYLTSLTCIVLFKHHSTDKAWKLSASGEDAKAVWIPKRIVDVSRQDFGPFLVVTLTHQLAARNGLYGSLSDAARFAEFAEQRGEAMKCAAEVRRWQQRGRGSPHPNAFA